ncbi:UNVERIFIED_CONTAM: Tricyclene synthase Oc15, chloroplastic [Sesamum radiatum]|uniref:Tricyclene synthase Oc15, chloroplastic n=1 Tax=Sesamum radiatum TaxID=300843 RepID=A0AAW2T2M6_SESRA
MASCNGLSDSSFPCFSKIRPGFARIGKIEPVRFVSKYGAGKQKWNFEVGGVTPTSEPSRPHQDCPDNFDIEYNEKIDEIRQVLQSKGEDDLVLVDAIQRVGLSSYYEEEIGTLLRKHYVASCSCIYEYNSLHDVSLLFRLLRQHGHYISPDVFNNFKGKDGRFRRNLSQDIRGLMELLRYPYHKTIPRTRKDFLQDFEGINGWGKTLRELALMDLRKGQSVYQGEFAQVSKWWNELGLAKEIKLARNQPPKWYTWSMSILIDDFSLSLQRVELTKSIAFVYLIDDIFDVVGTLDELTIFTEAVNKWEYATVDTLPDYMKTCYLALLETTNNIGREICKRHGHDPIDSLKTSWGTLCSAFLVEAKWLASGDLPTADKYFENAKVSTGVYVVAVHLFFLLGLGNGSAIHLNDVSQLVSSVATVLRLWDDLGSAKDEHQDGRDGSYLDCYRKDHRGLSVAQARDHAIDTIASEWKNLNEVCFRLDHRSASSFKRASLNLARITPLMYDYDDNQRLPVLEEYVKFMLLNQTT